MKYAVLGWPAAGPTLNLDHRRFSYAGKFVMSNTGKAVARVDGDVVAAVAFNEDRTDPETVWLRYITVDRDRRGDGIGPRLAAFAGARIKDRGYERLNIAVNNPFAYHAMFKAGFGYGGEETGIAELVLTQPGDRSTAAYQDGLDVYRGRDGLAPAERSFLDAKIEATPPRVISVPDADDDCSR